MTTNLYDLPSIRLDELVSRAALLTRVDRKYLLAVSDLPALLHGLGTGAQVLEMHSRREFAYRSTYFDTPELDAYLATVRRRRRRFKVRIRSYLDSDQHFLEVKTTGVRGATVKHRVPHCGHGLDARAHAHIDMVLAQAGMPGDRSELGWALTNTYRRTTLYVPSVDGRATIDTEPTWALPHGPAIAVPASSSSRRSVPARPATSTGCSGRSGIGPARSPSSAWDWPSCAPNFPLTAGCGFCDGISSARTRDRRGSPWTGPTTTGGPSTPTSAASTGLPLITARFSRGVTAGAEGP